VALDIRGEMEAAAAELEGSAPDDDSSPEVGTPASEPETPEEGEQSTESEKPEAPATEESDEDDRPAPEAKPEVKPQPTLEDDGLPVGGSIPVPRVRSILANARTKAREAVEAEFKQKYGAHEEFLQLPADDLREAVRIIRYASENPVEYFHQLRTRLENAGLLERERPAARQDAPAPKGDGKPQPDVLLEDGRLVYSHEQLQKLLEYDRGEVLKQVDERFKPIADRDKAEREERQFRSEAQRVLAEASQWPGFNEHRKEIAETMASKRVSVDVAYGMVLRSKGTHDEKQIREDERKKVLASLKKKPSASTETGRTTPATPDFKGKSTREILEATAAELGMDGDDE
jgi:PAS domain-containing protein